MEKGLAKSIEPFFEKVEKLSKIQRIVISVLLFALIAGGFIYFSYWPKIESISKLNTKLDQLEKKLEIAQKNAADLKKFQAKMDEAEAQFKMAMKKLPDKEEIPSLLASISNSGQQVGLEFLLFEPKPEKRKEFYAEIPVAMNIKGDYHNRHCFSIRSRASLGSSTSKIFRWPPARARATRISMPDAWPLLINLSKVLKIKIRKRKAPQRKRRERNKEN